MQERRTSIVAGWWRHYRELPGDPKLSRVTRDPVAGGTHQGPDDRFLCVCVPQLAPKILSAFSASKLEKLGQILLLFATKSRFCVLESS